MEANMTKEVRLSTKNLINIYFHNLLSIGCFYVFGKNFDPITHINWSFAILGIAMQLQILRILLKNRYLKDR